MAVTIQLRRGTLANWTSANPILAQGEMGVVTNDNSYKIGDGITAFNSLPFTNLTGNFTAALQMSTIAEPGTPPINSNYFYFEKIAGKVFAEYKTDKGYSSRLEGFFGDTSISFCKAIANATTLNYFAVPVFTTIGTATARVVANTTYANSLDKVGFPSATAAGSFSSYRQTATIMLNSNGLGTGGYYISHKFVVGDAAAVAGARMFVGLRQAVTAPTNVEPNTLTNLIGVGAISTSNNMQVFVAGSVAQAPIDLGANFPANTLGVDAYQLEIGNDPFALRTFHLKLTRFGSDGNKYVYQNTFSGASTVVPVENLAMAFIGWRCNNATALAVSLDFSNYYITKD